MELVEFFEFPGPLGWSGFTMFLYEAYVVEPGTMTQLSCIASVETLRFEGLEGPVAWEPTDLAGNV